MEEKKQSMRMTVMLSENADQALTRVVNENGSWRYRKNTIMQAAIIAFAELDSQKREEYLKKIKLLDARRRW